MITFREILFGEPAVQAGVRMTREHSWGVDYLIDPWIELKQADYIIGCFDGEKLVAISLITRVASPDAADNGLPWLADAVVLSEYRRQGIYERRMEYLKNQRERLAGVDYAQLR